jgi:hypothetical protein
MRAQVLENNAEHALFCTKMQILLTRRAGEKPILIYSKLQKKKSRDAMANIPHP